jgi:hypothetical protein
VFTIYSSKFVQRYIPEAVDHPVELIEASLLQSVKRPAITYPLHESLDKKKLIASGALSSAQLESVAYACQTHARRLPSGARAGFFVGDGTGVGKGRQMAALILDSLARGQKKHVWISASADLALDAERDLRHIGCQVPVIAGFSALDKLRTLDSDSITTWKKGAREAVLFLTYHSLSSSVQDKRSNGTQKIYRMTQLLEWLGGGTFEGMLIFDECHRAKQNMSSATASDGSGRIPSKKMTEAVMQLQKDLQSARVVYCSATGVSDLGGMAYMERLGLWGRGTWYPDFQSFANAVEDRGLSGLELVASSMKASGMYVARSLSMKGTEFAVVEVPVSQEERAVWDKAAALWARIREVLLVLHSSLGANQISGQLGKSMNQYWGAHQRFFRCLCVAMKVPACVTEARNALARNEVVVIGLQSTGEAAQVAMLSDFKAGNVIGDTLPSACRHILSQYLEQNFPSTPEIYAKAQEQLLAYAKSIELPPSPLDDIIDQLGGPSEVAEMTGRSQRVIRSKKSKDAFILANRSSASDADRINIEERKAFQTGKKRIAIISDAASTGVSLHAEGPNAKRRFHMTLELAWSPEKAVQQLGRTHRANQSSAPRYALMVLSIAGERRFTNAVGNRLLSMGAITRGDRRAAAGVSMFDSQRLIPKLATNALSRMCAAAKEGIPPDYVDTEALWETPILKIDGTRAQPPCANAVEFTSLMFQCLEYMGGIEEVGKNVGRFLNRLLGLPLNQQEQLFDFFFLFYDYLLKTADESVSAKSIPTLPSPATTLNPPIPDPALLATVVREEASLFFNELRVAIYYLRLADATIISFATGNVMRIAPLISGALSKVGFYRTLQAGKVSLHSGEVLVGFPVPELAYASLLEALGHADTHGVTSANLPTVESAIPSVQSADYSRVTSKPATLAPFFGLTLKPADDLFRATIAEDEEEDRDDVKLIRATGTHSKPPPLPPPPPPPGSENTTHGDTVAAPATENDNGGDDDQAFSLAKRRKFEDTFALSADKTRRKGNLQRCPVCGRPFPTLTNEELNFHVDNCLMTFPSVTGDHSD